MTQKITILAMLVTFLLAAGCGGGDAKSSAKSAVVLNFALRDLDGNTVDLNQFKGKVVILDVWDTWCAPCRMEIPEFVQLYDQYRDQGLQMIGVAMARKGIPEVRKFAEEYKMNYLNLVGSPVLIQVFGEIKYIPTTFVIDKQGRLHNTHVGYTARSVFEDEIKALLAS
jgi:thiol-disulfide isomerase/thioredoxin